MASAAAPAAAREVARPAPAMVAVRLDGGTPTPYWAPARPGQTNRGVGATTGSLTPGR